MSNTDQKQHFEEFLGKQLEPTKPTPIEIELARQRFSSRVEPPKT